MLVKKNPCILLGLCLVLQTAASLEWYQLGNPHLLTAKTFQSALSSPHQVKVVKFFTPWCGYCRKLKGAFDQVKKRFEGGNTQFYQVNCEDETILCRQLNVMSYPFTAFIGKGGALSSSIDGTYPPQVMEKLLQQGIEKANKIKAQAGKEYQVELPSVKEVSLPSEVASEQTNKALEKEVEVSNDPELIVISLKEKTIYQFLLYALIGGIGIYYFSKILLQSKLSDTI